MANSTFNPTKDIPSLEGKVILITGGNNGLGKQSALDLAKHNPAQIWIAGRNAKTAEGAITEVEKASPGTFVRFVELDLTSFESVKAAATTLRESLSRLDILLLNAGIMACPPGLTKQGYEVQFGTNHVGHAMLLKLLTPLLLSTAELPKSDVRVVFVSSVAHKFPAPGGIQFDSLKTKAEGISTNARYGQSKLANVLHAQEFASLYPQLTTVSIHPGTVKTDLQKSDGGSLLVRGFQKLVVPLIGVTVEEGAKSQLWAATAKGVANGEYYEPVGVLGKGGKHSKDKQLAKRLWEWTEAELSKYAS